MRAGIRPGTRHRKTPGQGSDGECLMHRPRCRRPGIARTGVCGREENHSPWRQAESALPGHPAIAGSSLRQDSSRQEPARARQAPNHPAEGAAAPRDPRESSAASAREEAPRNWHGIGVGEAGESRQAMPGWGRTPRDHWPPAMRRCPWQSGNPEGGNKPVARRSPGRRGRDNGSKKGGRPRPAGVLQRQCKLAGRDEEPGVPASQTEGGPDPPERSAGDAPAEIQGGGDS